MHPINLPVICRPKALVSLHMALEEAVVAHISQDTCREIMSNLRMAPAVVAGMTILDTIQVHTVALLTAVAPRITVPPIHMAITIRPRGETADAHSMTMGTLNRTWAGTMGTKVSMETAAITGRLEAAPVDIHLPTGEAGNRTIILGMVDSMARDNHNHRSVQTRTRQSSRRVPIRAFFTWRSVRCSKSARTNRSAVHRRHWRRRSLDKVVRFSTTCEQDSSRTRNLTSRSRRRCKRTRRAREATSIIGENATRRTTGA